jgi:16S rRNA C967 or C1407 C5-methylase (RsmB/RsmF family)
MNAEHHRARNRRRMKRWRSMPLPALLALRERMVRLGIAPPAILFERIAKEANKLRLDPEYARKVLIDAPVDGRERHRAKPDLRTAARMAKAS